MNDWHFQLRDALTGRLTGADQENGWAALCDAGVVGLRVPEAQGGLNQSMADAAPVFDVLGELCLGLPYLETAVVAAGLLTRLGGERADEWLTRIARGAQIAIAGLDPLPAGEMRARPLDGHWRLDGQAKIVMDAMAADAVLICAPDADGTLGLFLVDPHAAGLSMRPVPTFDGRMAADLTFDAVVSSARFAGDVAAAVEITRDEAIAALCIEAAALMRRLVSDTVAYAKQRTQFGQTISSFQVVQHRLVDMNIQMRRASAIAGRALAMLDAPAAVRQRAISAAKVTICRAGRYVGQNAVQLHGGMGMTRELIIGRCFKRLMVIEAQLGSADHHLRRFQRLRSAA